MHEALAKYFNLVATEAQRDMEVFHTGWVVYTIAPLTLYLCYCFVKWYFLLMPITMPMTIWAANSRITFITSKGNANN